MSHFPVTWVLVADSGRSRLFSLTAANAELSELEDRVNPEARLHEGDLTSDVPGTSHTAGGASQHRMAAAHSQKHQHSEEFAQDIAQSLKSSFDEHAFERLVLISPPEFLGVLRAKLDNTVCQQVAEVVGLDLTRESAEEIRKRLPPLHA